MCSETGMGNGESEVENDHEPQESEIMTVVFQE